MTELQLSFHGTGVRIEAEGAAAQALGSLAEDFEHFAVGGLLNPAIRIELVAKSAAQKALPPRLFRTRMCQVHGWGRTRVCDFGEGTRVWNENRGGLREFRIESPDAALLHEICFMVVLSAVGEMLDRQGFHRVHALGLSSGERGCVISLPQGGGKSALAWLLAAGEGRERILSDESPLLFLGPDGPSIEGFPIRIALRPEVAAALGAGKGRAFPRKIFDRKLLFPIPAAKTARSSRLTDFLVGEAGYTDPAIVPASRLRVLRALVAGMVIGLGNAQMAEYLLRWESIPALVRTAFSRLGLALRIAAGARPWRFRLCGDARRNLAELRRFLADQKSV